MSIHVRKLPIVICAAILFSITAFAQTPERRQTDSTAPALGQNPDSVERVANEIGLLRKSVQTLNVRLSEISEKVLARDSNESGSSNVQKSISVNLELLTRAEQRADMLRKQLVEVIEKDTSLRVRLVQIEEDMRPENIERSLNVIGTTRTSELREARRRVFENERRGVESLINHNLQSRRQLEEDVRQADTMVSRLRERLFPLIEKEIDKIKPD
jgi:DNA anti-recombination protein RmuC